jgi:hypothetical protein
LDGSGYGWMETWVYILVVISFFFSAFHSRSFGSDAVLSCFSRQEYLVNLPSRGINAAGGLQMSLLRVAGAY